MITAPELDPKVLQEKVNEYAMKGAIEAIKEYYSGYNSPFRKALDEQLKQREVQGIELPDILSVLNDSIATEINSIAHASIAQTMIPQVKKFLTRANAEIKMSDFLKQIIELSDPESPDDLSVDVQTDDKYNWLDVTLSVKEKTYRITFHEDWEAKKQNIKRYQLLSMPSEGAKHNMMKLEVDGVKIEIPFSQNVLHDDVIGYLAGLVIARTKITMDTREFSDDMFPEKCHCH